jgi:hypothetical protein
MQSSRGQLMLATLFSVLALGALTAAAQAVEAPRWSIEGTALTAGKTHFITAKLYSTSFRLQYASVIVSCTGLNLKTGSLLGSEPGNAGKSEEAVEFTGCVIAGKSGGKSIEKCVVESPTPGVILTNPIRSELVETEKAEPAKNKGSLLILFEPLVEGSLLTLKFKTEAGGHCPLEGKIAGSVAGQVLTDPENGKLGELIELGQKPREANSWLVNFPATPITRVTKINEGITKEVTLPQLTFFTELVGVEGTALVLLAKRTAKGEIESELRKWSPLP